MTTLLIFIIVCLFVADIILLVSLNRIMGENVRLKEKYNNHGTHQRQTDTAGDGKRKTGGASLYDHDKQTEHHIYIHPQHMDKSNTTSTDTKDTQKAFDPYAPHKIKWWGWPLLLLLIIGAVATSLHHSHSNTRSEPHL